MRSATKAASRDGSFKRRFPSAVTLRCRSAAKASKGDGYNIDPPSFEARKGLAPQDDGYNLLSSIIKSEVHHVAVGDDVFLAFQP